MPIGDLLAEISGEKSSSAPTTSRAPLSVGVKRKPEGDTNGASKVSRARYNDGPGASSAGVRNSHGNVVREAQPITRSIPSRPYPAAAKPVPSTNAQRPGAPTNARPYTGTSAPNRANGKPAPLPTASARPHTAPPTKPARPSPTTPTVAESSKAPKKGSFAEIMARGAKAQQVMPKAGAIQHKPMEKTLSKKERLEKATGKGKFAKKAAESGAPLNDMSRNKARPTDASKIKPGSKSRPTSSGSDVPEKKMKKSAMATTGYTGTARPRPAAATKSSASGAPRARPSASSRTAGGLLAPPKPRRSAYEEEDEDDEDLDDFIVDDEDDGPQPRVYGYGDGYDSDQSSDMEAGYDDVESEETRAERAAREEDRREKALEEKLKREKERRKRLGY